MKNKTLFQTFIILTSMVSGSAYSDPIPVTFKPETIRLIPQNTFIPPGFDDNDSVQLIVSGYLPNSCYKAGTAEVQVDHKEKKIYIQNTAYFYGGCWCAEVSTPYMHAINLGILPAGQYKVFVQDQKDIPHDQGSLAIAVSRAASPDDYLYAPIQDAFVETLDHPQSTGGQVTFVLRGQFSSDCMHLQEVKVNYRSPHIVEILPIARMDEGRTCRSASVPFESRVKIQSPWEGSTLIYVRSLNGQALSKVIDL